MEDCDDDADNPQRQIFGFYSNPPPVPAKRTGAGPEFGTETTAGNDLEYVIREQPSG